MTPREHDLDAVADALLRYGYCVGRHGEELHVRLSHHPVDGTLTVDDGHTAHLRLQGSSPVSTDVPGSQRHADAEAVVAALRELTR
jgi:hypothetical protein